MSGVLLRRTLYAALALAFLLRHDLWLWNDPQLRWGLPVGLTYHVAYCLSIAVLLWVLVRRLWPYDDGERR